MSCAYTSECLSSDGPAAVSHRTSFDSLGLQPALHCTALRVSAESRESLLWLSLCQNRTGIVLGREPVETLEAWVGEFFEQVPDKALQLTSLVSDELPFGREWKRM